MSEVETVANIAASEEMRKREAELDKQAIEIFSHYRLYAHVDLMMPNVLVKVLPKEMFSGNILIPDIKSTNKPIYEGIVLRTWLPQITYNKEGDHRWIHSELFIGDHVLFPHFAGQPVPGLDTDVYRSIPEGINKRGGIVFGNETGVIFAKVDYQRPSVEEVVARICGEFENLSDYFVLRLLRRLREEFDIVVKVKGSRTLSGR